MGDRGAWLRKRPGFTLHVKLVKDDAIIKHNLLKAPYSSKPDIFFIQERINKLIYSINIVIKSGIW